MVFNQKTHKNRKITMQNFDYTPHIEAALRSEGGHLHVGEGGFSLKYGNTCLQGYERETAKTMCIASGLPVIDSRNIEFEALIKIVVSGPIIAVGREADPRPWGSLSYAPLGVVAAAYRAAGGEVHNIPDAEFDDGAFLGHDHLPASELVGFWLDYLRRAG